MERRMILSLCCDCRSIIGCRLEKRRECIKCEIGPEQCLFKIYKQKIIEGMHKYNISHGICRDCYEKATGKPYPR